MSKHTKQFFKYLPACSITGSISKKLCTPMDPVMLYGDKPLANYLVCVLNLKKKYQYMCPMV